VAPVSEEFWLSIDPDVTAVSRKLFEDGHFAQAVFEAAKHYEREVKRRSKLERSGVALMTEAFSAKNPVIKVADCSTITGLDIQQGVMHLSMGVTFRMRNPLGHEPAFEMQREEARDWIIVYSRFLIDLKRAPALVTKLQRVCRQMISHFVYNLPLWYRLNGTRWFRFWTVTRSAARWLFSQPTRSH
jgi:uncharacterized protein (TIGR02391 family)